MKHWGNINIILLPNTKEGGKNSTDYWGKSSTKYGWGFMGNLVVQLLKTWVVLIIDNLDFGVGWYWFISQNFITYWTFNQTCFD